MAVPFYPQAPGQTMSHGVAAKEINRHHKTNQDLAKQQLTHGISF
jgi:hypothetical protein